MPIEARYATGKRAKAQCPKCGLVVRYQELVKDYRGVWVCPDCNDPQHPQEKPPRRVVDAVALRHPQPLQDLGLTVARPFSLISETQVGDVTVTVI